MWIGWGSKSRLRTFHRRHLVQRRYWKILRRHSCRYGPKSWYHKIIWPLNQNILRTRILNLKLWMGDQNWPRKWVNLGPKTTRREANCFRTPHHSHNFRYRAQVKRLHEDQFARNAKENWNFRLCKMLESPLSRKRRKKRQNSRSRRIITQFFSALFPEFSFSCPYHENCLSASSNFQSDGRCLHTWILWW